ncbi:DoxX family protein [Streptomyces sp. B93]|uniref:DoxX family protein n=1 Tax=Streptomyces sp. B93 TaxID=2824875 RepID=UPI001B35B653|nr:DoxX family protein [Streptomyces sp. B93]MBQ1090077.1 DoxX family protein [Streptomyces sp. B93]
MDVFAWILTSLLALFFLTTGLVKTVTPYTKLMENPSMGWAVDFTAWQVKAIAVLEVLGAVGVVVPWAFDTAKVVAPIAAAGLAVTMVGAMSVHGRRAEWSQVAVNAVLFALAVAVAAVRFAQL